MTKTCDYMKKNICIWCSCLLLAWGVSSCSHDAVGDATMQLPAINVPVYKMQLHAVCQQYDDTRAVNRWENGAKVYLRFHDAENGIVTGVATYSDETELWDIQPTKTLTPTDMNEADCEAFYFVNSVSATDSKVSLSSESAAYVDAEATYMFYEDLLIVRAMMMPKTGRIRFKGVEGQSFGVSGLSCLSEFDFINNHFLSKATKITSTVSDDGYSAFYYTFFADEENKTLVFDYTDHAGFKSTFTGDMLQAGRSGYITIPTIDKQSYWTLVNKKSLSEIVLPEVDAVKAGSVRSASVILRTTINSVGNGVISDAGFIYSTQADPTAENGVKVSCGTAISMELRLKELTPETTYYARAYATNERGTALSDVIQFTTISKEEDKSSIIKDGFGDDDNLNDEASSDGSFGKGGYNGDDDLNDPTTSSGNIGRDKYGNDDNLNDLTEGTGSISKEEYSDDDNLN